jgi:sugar/nucleoside kinase (ribokinase family)
MQSLFIPKAHVIKVSDEELEFITGEHDESKAIASLFVLLSHLLNKLRHL